MVWSLAEARRNGYEVSNKLDEWTRWSIDKSLSKNKQGKVAGIGNKEGVVQLLLSLDPSGNDASRDDIRRKLTALLSVGQLPDGSWKPGGQLPSQKRPKPETTVVSTMWLALSLLDDASNDATARVVQRALTYIDKAPPGRSTEWYVVRLLLAVKRKDRPSRDRLVKQLRKQQQADGGWGWIVGDPADALGTGMAIYALGRAGLDRRDASIARAQKFLVDSQRDDGAWPVRGTKANKKGQVQETAVYWGTTWAALGLMAGLPSQQ
jgi:squalene-hopene/tetraprenyl-beta-curcumene cyclase